MLAKSPPAATSLKPRACFQTVWMPFAFGQSCGRSRRVENAVELAAVDMARLLAREYIGTWMIAASASHARKAFFSDSNGSPW